MLDTQQMSRQITQKITDLKGRRILIFGDVGIDEYVQGEVYRISPEAPVPVVDVRSVSNTLGLSANVAANVVSLGGEPLLVSVVGDDKEGEGLRSLLTEKGIAANYLVTDPQRTTTAKTRVMSGQHHIVRVDYENRHPVNATTQSQLNNRIEELIANCDGVIIQDYAKGLVDKQNCQMVIAKAKEHKKFVVVDPYRTTPLEIYRGASLMTPNRDEALELARQIPGLKDWQDIDAIGPALSEKISAPNMVITLGAQGMKIFNGSKATHIPTFARKVFDVSGAGDTVISAITLGLAAGWDLTTSGYLANLAAGVVVGHIGAVACTVEDLLASAQSHHN